MAEVIPTPPDQVAPSGGSTEKLFALLYEELYRTAARRLQREARDHTLQPAAVVNETYLRLVEHSSFAETERTRFLAVAARAMHQVLVDHARRREAAKRGGGWQRITLSDAVAPIGTRDIDVLALDHALIDLARDHPRAARIVELRFFGGLEEREIARVLGVSRTTVQGEWRLARAWLHRVVAEPKDSA